MKKRKPIQVLVLPYRIIKNKIEYAIFLRSDFPVWQFISGGVEEGESKIQAVIREVVEETSIALTIDKIIRLNSKVTLPVECVGGKDLWDDSVLVIPEYSFAFRVCGQKIELSPEHCGYKWLSYEKAKRSLEYDSNKNALWELNKRLGG